MAYYYTPTIVDTSSGAYLVGKDDSGTIVSAMEDLVGGINALKLDREIDPSRYVLACPEEQVAPAGWDVKTAEEVNADYPGLIGG